MSAPPTEPEIMDIGISPVTPSGMAFAIGFPTPAQLLDRMYHECIVSNHSLLMMSQRGQEFHKRQQSSSHHQTYSFTCLAPSAKRADSSFFQLVDALG